MGECVKKLLNIEDIFKGENPPMPKNADSMYALTAPITAYVENIKLRPKATDESSQGNGFSKSKEERAKGIPVL